MNKHLLNKIQEKKNKKDSIELVDTITSLIAEGIKLGRNNLNTLIPVFEKLNNKIVSSDKRHSLELQETKEKLSNSFDLINKAFLELSENSNKQLLELKDELLINSNINNKEIKKSIKKIESDFTKRINLINTQIEETIKSLTEQFKSKLEINDLESIVNSIELVETSLNALKNDLDRTNGQLAQLVIPKEVKVASGKGVSVERIEKKDEIIYKVNADAKVLVQNIGSNSAVLRDDLNKGLLDPRYINANGDTMTGVLIFNPPVYKDIQYNIESGKFGVANIPTWTSLIGNLYAYTFAVNDYIDLGSQELNHEYKEGSDISIHVHWVTNGVDVTERGVKWEIEYTIGNDSYNENGIGLALITPVVVSKETKIPANTTNLSGGFTSVGTITGTGLKIGTQVKMRLRRITSVSTAPTNNPFVLQVGLHIQCDTIGSRTVTAK